MEMENVVQIFFKFGPFGFASYFLYVGIKRATRNYNDATKETRPLHERILNRSWWFTYILIGVSVAVWCFYYIPQNWPKKIHVIRGEFRDEDKQTSIKPENRNFYLHKYENPELPTCQIYWIIVKETPFKEETYPITYLSDDYIGTVDLEIKEEYINRDDILKFKFNTNNLKYELDESKIVNKSPLKNLSKVSKYFKSIQNLFLSTASAELLPEIILNDIKKYDYDNQILSQRERIKKEIKKININQPAQLRKYVTELQNKIMDAYKKDNKDLLREALIALNQFTPTQMSTIKKEGYFRSEGIKSILACQYHYITQIRFEAKKFINESFKLYQNFPQSLNEFDNESINNFLEYMGFATVNQRNMVSDILNDWKNKTSKSPDIKKLIEKTEKLLHLQVTVNFKMAQNSETKLWNWFIGISDKNHPLLSNIKKVTYFTNYLDKKPIRVVSLNENNPMFKTFGFSIKQFPIHLRIEFNDGKKKFIEEFPQIVENLTNLTIIKDKSTNVAIFAGSNTKSANSSDESIAVVDPISTNGNSRVTIKGINAGMATITVLDQSGTTGYMNVNVISPPKLSSTSKEIQVGQTDSIEIVEGGPITVKKYDENIVKVDIVNNGSKATIKGITPGIVNITFKNENGSEVTLLVNVKGKKINVSLNLIKGDSTPVAIFAGSRAESANSSDESIAIARPISSGGSSIITVDAINTGKAIITVLDQSGTTGYINVNVISPPKLSSTSKEIQVGQTDSIEIVEGGPVTVKKYDENIVKVDIVDNGSKATIKGVTPGIVNITFKNENGGEVTLPVNVKGEKINVSLNLIKGDSTPVAIFAGSRAESANSSDESIAIARPISSGGSSIITVDAINTGKAIITVLDQSGTTGYINVNVISPPKLSSTSKEIEVGQTDSIKIVEGGPVTIKKYDEKIVKVDIVDNGLKATIKGVTPGIVNITFKNENGGEVTLPVNVK